MSRTFSAPSSNHSPCPSSSSTICSPSPTQTMFAMHSSAPIHKLPPELISRIFLIGSYQSNPNDSPFILTPNEDCIIPPQSNFQLLVSHICSRWRQVALNATALWTTLHFREPMHIQRAETYLARCIHSPHLLDILVDTVAAADHIPGVTLCRDEFHPIFNIITPYVHRWRSLHLKVRDNECKAGARKQLSSCGPARNLETLQLYHFENFTTVQTLHLATYRPPVMIFENTVPRLRNLSLIGVNVPWVQSPWLRNLHNIEFALHTESIRPSYEQWERILRGSPDLQKLTLHYSGPRLPPGSAGYTPAAGVDEGQGDLWPSADSPTRKIPLPVLSDLSFTDLDPDYLLLLLDHLDMPSVKHLTLDLPEQDFTSFVELLAGVPKPEPEEPDPVLVAGNASHDTGSVTPALSDAAVQATPDTVGDGPSDDDTQENAEPSGPIQPPVHFKKLEHLSINALECSLTSWRTLLESSVNVRFFDLDFSRLSNVDGVWKMFTGDIMGADDTTKVPEVIPLLHEPLLPDLKVLKLSGVTGRQVRSVVEYRERCGCPAEQYLVRWCERRRGKDLVLDKIIDKAFVWDRIGMREGRWVERGKQSEGWVMTVMVLPYANEGDEDEEDDDDDESGEEGEEQEDEEMEEEEEV